MRGVSCNTFSARVAAESSGVCAVGAVNASSGVGPRRGRVCDPGWDVDADLSCAACAPGAFSAGYTTRTNKRHRHHSSLCSACDPGKFSTAVGADSGETCVEGPAGTRAPESGMTARCRAPNCARVGFAGFAGFTARAPRVPDCASFACQLARPARGG
jgi:hypothetical protein